MATKKTKTSSEPVVTVGSHSVHTLYPDGRVNFVVDDEKLRADVMEALAIAEADRKSFPVSAEKKSAIKAKTSKTKK